MASPPAIARGELSSCILAAASFVGLRSFVFLRYEQLFDSDQAIVGLMAKHASELRGLPLFFYGQHYMLGVQAWVAVPFFWIGGPTVAMLRLPIVLINAAVAVAIVAALTRCGIRPIWALAAVLPLVATPPCTSAELVSTLGASIEPFAYVIVRIPFYQAQVERNQSNAVTIRRMPCTEGTRVAEWCIADPLHR